jgi:hypothetical protein
VKREVACGIAAFCALEGGKSIWADHSLHGRYLAGRKARQPRVFADGRLVRGQVDAEGLVGRHEAFEPLDLTRSEFGQGVV